MLTGSLCLLDTEKTVRTIVPSHATDVNMNDGKLGGSQAIDQPPPKARFLAVL